MISASMMGQASQGSLELLQIQAKAREAIQCSPWMVPPPKAGSMDVSEESLLKAREMMT